MDRDERVPRGRTSVNYLMHLWESDPARIAAVDALLEETFRAEQQHFWFHGFRRFVEPLIVHATQGLTRPRLLDAGCGTGRNYPLLEKYGLPLGLELSLRGLRYARQRGIPRLTQGSVTDLPFASASIDVVLSFDVLYSLHPDAEQAAIQEMFRVLRPRGFVIVNVAALPSLTGDHSALAGEVHRYVRPELRAKITNAGFRVARLTYTNASLLPLTAAVRAFQRLRGVAAAAEGRGDFYVPPAPVNALLSGALAAESSVIKAGLDMPLGSSLLCLAQKP
jgi:SAM-dependent methyltransferase